MTASESQSRQWKVPQLEVPLRLDKYLIERFPVTSRTYWKSHLTDMVRVDGKKPAKGQMLRGGESIQLTRLPSKRPPPLQPNPKISLRVLFEDPYLLAIDKPAGIPCLPLEADETETVINGIIALRPAQTEVDPENWEAGLIHRLDNDTSGVLLLAKTPAVKEKLSQINHEGKILKEYQAWVHGRVDQGKVLRDPIAHHPKNSKKMIIPSDPAEAKKYKARPAQTRVEVLKAGDRFSLLRLGISKGLRHQIRIHLAHWGHPIVGDILYGGEALPGLKRQLLHADQIHFRHPVTHQNLHIGAPLPEDFKIPKTPKI